MIFERVHVFHALEAEFTAETRDVNLDVIIGPRKAHGLYPIGVFYGVFFDGVKVPEREWTEGAGKRAPFPPKRTGVGTLNNNGCIVSVIVILAPRFPFYFEVSGA